MLKLTSFKNLFHRVAMTAWAVLYSSAYALPVFAAPRDWFSGVVDAKKKVVETVKDALEAGRSIRHFEQFWAETQTSFWNDLLGRSWYQTVVIACVWLGLTYTLYGSGNLWRKLRGKEDSSTTASLTATHIICFVVAIIAGWAFELLRTYHQYRVVEGRLEGVHAFSLLGFVALGLLLSTGIFLDLRRTAPALPVPIFNPEAEPGVPEDEEEAEAESAEAEDADEPTPDAETEPHGDPEPEAEPAEELGPVCAKCGQYPGADPKFCRHCGNVVTASPSFTPCPSCGNPKASGRFCNRCGKALKPAEEEKPAAKRKHRSARQRWTSN
jgi:hypothetical protein